jgi:hypothetical protein
VFIRSYAIAETTPWIFTRRSATERQLKVGNFDLNSLGQVQQLVRALTQILSDLAVWHKLEVSKYCYFRSPDARLPTCSGWYVICDGEKTPLYVGQADNIDDRLNSENGSRDNFANPQRTSDLVRNFIKAFRTMDYITTLQVGVVCEPELLQQIGFSAPFQKVDQDNVEKVLGLFRNIVLKGGSL